MCYFVVRLLTKTIAASNSEESRRISSPDDGNRNRGCDQGVYASGDGEGYREHGDQNSAWDNESLEDHETCCGATGSCRDDGRRCSDSGGCGCSINNNSHSIPLTRSLPHYNRHSNDFVVSPPPVRSLFSTSRVDDDAEDAVYFQNHNLFTFGTLIRKDLNVLILQIVMMK